MTNTLIDQMSLVMPHSQVAVFRPSLELPFNEWTRRHSNHGFVLRDGSVSFATVDAVRASIRCLLAETFDGSSSNAQRIIRVPFHIHEDGVIVATTSDERPLSVPAGNYDVNFELWLPPEDETARVALTFVRTERPQEADVLRADGKLRVERPLLLTGEPAT